jgi:TRAP-type uncharacterized transport system substrate-binding protein
MEEEIMFRAIFMLMIAVLNLATFAPALAGEFGTREEAIAMVKRVQEKFRRDGADATFRAVTAQAKIFHDRDLYPFVYDMNGVVVAHGAKADLVGKNLIDFKDQDGRFVIQQMIAVVKGPGSGWVDLRWTNPTTKEIEAKSSYVERMGQYWAGVGVYTDEQINENTIGIISGSPNSDDTYLQMAYDLAAVLNDGNRLRILPIAGIGGPQNIRDVRSLKGVDIGLTQTNILNNFRRSNEQLGKFDKKVVYIAKLFNEEAHLLVGADITSLEQLRGRKVNLDEVGSGTSYSVRDIFKRIGLQIEEVSMSQTDALEELKKGEIAATVLIAGKPARSIQRLSAEDGLHLLPIPYLPALAADYLPASLSHEDYPNVISAGHSIDTLAVGAVLIAYNWPKNTDRYRRVQRFVEAFFPRIADFRDPPRHPKWREVTLAATLEGWDRFEPAQAWVEANNSQQASRLPSPQPTKDPEVPPGVDPLLFQQFLEWRRSTGGKQ